jgi:hypothetical protein
MSSSRIRATCTAYHKRIHSTLLLQLLLPSEVVGVVVAIVVIEVSDG